jgi:4'-phosphopantetheinyl transferase
VIVEVWLSTARAGGSERRALEGVLSPAERARIDATVDGRLREQRLVGYALRRRALARALGLAAAEVPLRLLPDGRARLAGTTAIGISLSHTEGLVAVALARGARVGIDVERVRARRSDVVATARRFFAPAEAARVARAAPRDRLHLYFQLWTRKESLAKAAGARDLFAALACPLPARGGRWRIRSLALSPGHAAALAVEVPDPHAVVRCHRFPQGEHP